MSDMERFTVIANTLVLRGHSGEKVYKEIQSSLHVHNLLIIKDIFLGMLISYT